MSPTDDKRRHPRVVERIRVRSSSQEAVELETIDLSAGGLSCTAPAFLPLMTKLAVSLVLPGHKSSQSGSDDSQTVEGEAVVVRSEPSSPVPDTGSYRVALFFSRMEEGDRSRLLDFLGRRSGK
jgi:c-di-GMP-binding flagellar brake protein YcgR